MWWLREVPSDAGLPAAVATAWANARTKIGFLPNIQRLYALRPARYLGWLQHYSEVMRGSSGLSVIEREMIAVVVSSINKCEYCLTSHGAYLRSLTSDPTIDTRLRADWRMVVSNDRERAMLDLAERLTKDAHGTTAEDLDTLRRAGLSESEVFDTVETIATFNFTNRLTSGLGMVPNAEFASMGR